MINEGKLQDVKVENIMGNLLRFGVIISAIFVLIGGVFYLLKYGSSIPDYSQFRGEPESLKNISKIFSDTVSLHSRSIIQAGLLVLIATPIARVIFALIAFTIQKDIIYIAVSVIVLAILLLSFFNII